MTHGNQMWTRDAEAQLRQRHAAGLSFSVLAELFRVTRSAIAGKCARLGLTRNDGSAEANGKIGARISAQKRNPRRSKSNFARAVPPPKRVMKAGADSSATLPDVAAPAPSLNIANANLEPHHCRYIAGDDRLSCGHPRIDASPYCVAHTLICYRGFA